MVVILAVNFKASVTNRNTIFSTVFTDFQHLRWPIEGQERLTEPARSKLVYIAQLRRSFAVVNVVVLIDVLYIDWLIAHPYDRHDRLPFDTPVVREGAP